MPYKAKNFEHLLGMGGFSDKLLKNHFALYEGYVENANKLLEEGEYLIEKGQSSSEGSAGQRFITIPSLNVS